MRSNVVVTSIVLSLLVSVSAVGQSPEAAANQSEDSTLAGCLQAGPKDGEFVLVADDKQMYQLQPAEGVELAAHANHRVELTGTIEKNETGSVLKARTLKMVATACEA